MARPSWLIDGNRFATKIKNASGTCDLGQINWRSNPTRSCPRCQHTIDNSDVALAWPGLPSGVKFDPTDQEIIQHLLAKSGAVDEKPHPFLDEFIPTVNEEEGICYTHPQNLPGVKQDGIASHLFHRAIKAYNTGTRKRRKIHGDDSGDVRWHKTGRTKPVIVNGVQKGCKKIMVLYEITKGGKPEKTNWVMHQYHLGTEEEEKDGEFVISKVFYQQQQQVKQFDKKVEDVPDMIDDTLVKVDPVTPKSFTPKLPQNEIRFGPKEESPASNISGIAKDQDMGFADEVREPEASKASNDDNAAFENMVDQIIDHNEDYNAASENMADQIIDHNDDYNAANMDDQIIDHNDDQVEENHNLWDSGSQYIIDSQQLVEGLSLCDDLLQSQSPGRDGIPYDAAQRKTILSEYMRLGSDQLKKDLEECQNLVPKPVTLGAVQKKKVFSENTCLGPDPSKDLEESQNSVPDPATIELDTPPDFRLSQLEFGSQDSCRAWGRDYGC